MGPSLKKEQTAKYHIWFEIYFKIWKKKYYRTVRLPRLRSNSLLFRYLPHQKAWVSQNNFSNHKLWGAMWRSRGLKLECLLLEPEIKIKSSFSTKTSHPKWYLSLSLIVFISLKNYIKEINICVNSTCSPNKP